MEPQGGESTSTNIPMAAGAGKLEFHKEEKARQKCDEHNQTHHVVTKAERTDTVFVFDKGIFKIDGSEKAADEEER
eukprot:14231825-Heterocapsa_arctica.AAC.1